MELLGSNSKDSKNIKDKLANLKDNISSIEALGVSGITMLVCCGYYVALANILMAKDL